MEQSRVNLSRKNLVPMVSNEACVAVVSASMRDRYGDLRDAAKRVSRARGWTTKSFLNWLYGKNAPRMQDLIVLMADCPNLEREVGRMVEETRQCLQLSKQSAGGASVRVPENGSSSFAQASSASQ